MVEYEYSFKVKDIKPYIDYCENNNYINKSITTQNRVVYENKKLYNVIARITTTENKIVLDFKNLNKENNDLKVSNESLPLVINDNIEIIKSMLETLEFYETANNTRTRYVYEKDNVTFEIDDYTNPIMQVVAIEGNKEKVDKLYKEIKNIIGE